MQKRHEHMSANRVPKSSICECKGVKQMLFLKGYQKCHHGLQHMAYYQCVNGIREEKN